MRCDLFASFGDDTVVTYDLLCAMKPHASVINPSRGNLVDDEAVNRAIKEERLYYYLVDDPVNQTRAIHKDHPALSAPITTRALPLNPLFGLTSVVWSKLSTRLKVARPGMC